MRRKRISYQLSRLKDELKKRATAEEDAEKQKDYWRLYFKAVNAEGEVRELVMEAEIRRLIEFLAADGRYGDFLPDDKPCDKPKSSPPDDVDEDDIPPRQKGLWD